jgi:simple sugar transport system permease protein
MRKQPFSSILHREGMKSFLASLTAIVVGLLFGLVILFFTNASQALNGFMAILKGGFSDLRSMGQVLYFATPIMMTGLSVGFANKTGLFNIGASGQFIVGAFVAIYVGVKWTFLPGALHWIVALLMAMLAGGIWGAVPGLLKAYRNVNEVIACIMMNYVGMYLVNYVITLTIHDTLKNQTMRVASSANLPRLGLDQFFKVGNVPSSANSGILIAIAMCILIYIIIEKTRFGYELKACGFNRDAAPYAGINDNRSIVLSMVIAGALAGLGGALLYLAGSGKGIDVVDVLAAEGFNGIPVALLGMNNPLGILLSGLLIAYLHQGGFNMQLYNFAPEIVEIIVAVIIYFSAFALLFKSILRWRGGRKKKNDGTAAHTPTEKEDEA